MADKFELHNSTPAAPAGRVNVLWQSDAAGNVSAHHAQPQPIRLTHTWGLVGDVSALTVLPSIFVAEAGTQAAVLVGLRAKIASGTSVGVQVVRNGTNVGSVVTVTPTAATTALSVALSDGDELSLVLSAPVGAPTHLSATLILEHTP